jgi:hypothetical protein
LSGAPSCLKLEPVIKGPWWVGIVPAASLLLFAKPLRAEPETADAMGVWVGGGADLELRPSCTTDGDQVSCSQLFFWRVEGGVGWRFAGNLEALAGAGFGWSGEGGHSTHRMARGHVGLRVGVSLGPLEPALAALAGLAIEMDEPGAGVAAKASRPVAPMAGLELPVAVHLGAVRLTLAPLVFVVPFPEPAPGTVGRDHWSPWWAGIAIRVGYDDL